MSTVHIVADVFDQPGPVGHAFAELEQALVRQGLAVTRGDQPAEGAEALLIIGSPGKSPAVDQALCDAGVSVPGAPESVLIRRLPMREPRAILLTGSDERGLLYAIREAADAVRFAPQGEWPLAALRDARESPALTLRSLSVHLFNADLERPWYYSEDYWRQYFTTLVGNRFNTFILCFADQTNYMAPPYPWLFDLADYPEVRVAGLSQEEQARNLAMLRKIGELATEYGLDFALAIWQQQPVPHYGPSALQNPPEGTKLADYNTKALARLLHECPTIRRLQLRLNHESGIPEAVQHDYFHALFTVLKHQPRPVAVDLRYKGLKQETINLAVAAGLDVTVSTKFWCEHFGLPFHPTTQDPLYSASRYGYGTLLYRPRNYKVAYQLWNQGSNRVLTWGDADYAARFTESCALGDGEGYEVCAPLTNRGYRNAPGTWRLLAKPELEYYQWESERYWLFYLTFGRLGYNPHTAPAVWKRGFAARFGPAAEEVERAYHHASQVLPLLTATGLPSASEWAHWTEMDLGGPLDVYSVVAPSDYGQFYGARAWKPVEGRHCENWSATPNGFVEDALAGDVEAKWTPFQVSRELDRLAAESLAAIDAARQKIANPTDAEFRSTEVDIRALAYLARYHAAKKRAATHLAFFYATQEPGRLVPVRDHATAAAKAWESLAQVTDGVYSDNLVFGLSGEQVGTPAKPVNGHAGHWKDRVPNVQADVEFAQTLLATYNGAGKTFRVYPGEVSPVHPPAIRHTPVTSASPGADIVIDARIESEQPLKKVLLRFRPMDQTKPWVVIPMQEAGRGRYHATIPSNQFGATCDLLYYLEARIEGGGTLWPDWQKQAPYAKVAVRQEVTGRSGPQLRGRPLQAFVQ